SAIRERTTRCIPLPFPSMKSLDGCANLPMAPTRRGCLPSPHWNPVEVPFRRRTIRRCTRPPLLRSGGTASGLGCTTWSRADSSRRSPPRACRPSRKYDSPWGTPRSSRTSAAVRALVDSLAIYGPVIASPEMTRHLEERMTAIAEGHATLEDVVTESRSALHAVVAELKAHRTSLSRWIRDATFLEKDYG